jgi:hypothetical protein
MKKDYKFKSCIDECLSCAWTCNYCAAACTREKDPGMMAECIRLDMECAAICYAAAQLMSFKSSQSKAICSICSEICIACADECSKHQHDHCRDCAQQCRACAEYCRRMAA